MEDYDLNLFVIAWRFDMDFDDDIRVYMTTYRNENDDPPPPTFWGAVRQINNGANHYPDIACSSNRVNFVWAENGSLKFLKGTCDPNYRTWTFSSEKTLTSGGFGNNFSKPSISMSGNTCHVTFKYNMMEAPCLGYGYFNVSSSNPTINGLTCVEMNTGLNDPSISYASGYKTIFYERGGSIIRRKSNSYYWTETGFSSGKYPGISLNHTSGAVWTKFTSAPYFIQTDLVGGRIAKVNTGSDDRVFEESKRFYFPLDSKTAASQSYYMAQLDGLYVNGKRYHFDDQLRSEPLKMEKENEIALSWSVISDYVPDSMNLMRIYFTSEKGTYLLDTVTSDELWPDQKEEIRNVTKTVHFSAADDMSGNVVIEFDGNAPFVVTMLDAGTGANLARINRTDEPVIEIIPESMALYQNFPNPFNPETQIAFDLPEAVHVTVTVYDVSGKMVNELVNGYRQAGRHQVVFNGNDLSSGVYVYRMRAGKRMLTGRMLLLK